MLILPSATSCRIRPEPVERDDPENMFVYTDAVVRRQH